MPDKVGIKKNSMIQLICVEITDKDIWLLVIGGIISLIVSVIWTLFLFLTNFYKPNLKIELDGEVDKNGIRVNVINKGGRDAINLRVEACFYFNQNTYHLNIDKEDFLILPSNDNRIFKINDISESTRIYGRSYDSLVSDFKNKNCVLRVRIHAYHENSGFGRAFQKNFN